METLVGKYYFVIIIEVILYLICEIGYGSTNTPHYFLNLWFSFFFFGLIGTDYYTLFTG